MKQLAVNIRKNGFNYTQVCRKGRKAVYCQYVNEKTTYYEVFIIKSHDDIEIAGNKLEAAEQYPGDSDFGNTAWTCQTLEKAMERYNNLEIEHPKYFK
jgi:hypothetical protein